MVKSDWVDTPDAQHPVKWESADGTEVWYLSLIEALERIGRFYDDPALALDSGIPVRTPFAYYSMAL